MIICIILITKIDLIYTTDLVIHIIQLTGDLYIPRDCKLIGYQFGLGYKVQPTTRTADKGSEFQG